MSRHLSPRGRRALHGKIAAAVLAGGVLLAALALTLWPETDAVARPRTAALSVSRSLSVQQTPADDFVPTGNMNPLTGLCDGISDAALSRRPVAVMISNSYDSLPQWGISQADILIEMLAEGRITRLLALFQDPSGIEALASVRSARPYFIDMAQIYGAVYLHFGGSVPAYEAIASRSSLISIDGIRGSWEGTLFLRDPERRKTLGLEHSVYTDGEKIETALASLDEDLSLSGSPSAFRFGSEHSAQNGSPAQRVELVYSDHNRPWFEYDPSSGAYLRFQYGEAHRDAWLDRQIAVKNLLVLRMETRDVPDSSLHLVEVTTVGQGSGYYFCDGSMTEITWSKDAFDAPISFFLPDGQPLTAARGQSFLCVVPETADVIIS